MSELNVSVDAQALTKVVELGIQSQEQAIALNRLVQTVLAVDLVKGSRSLISSIDPLMEMYQKVFSKFQENLYEEVESMGPEDCLKYLDALHSAALRIVDLQRKIVQGKELFSTADLLTEEEKSMVRLVQSLETKEDKEMFITTLKRVLEDKKKTEEVKREQDDDFEDIPK